MNKSKDIGTRFESGCVTWLASHGIECRRAALAGANDQGDLHGLPNGGIAECKSVKTVGQALLREFKRQTLAERENAGADWAVLIMHRSGCDATGRSKSFAYNIAMLTVRDYDIGLRGMEATDATDDYWISMSMGEFAAMLNERAGRDGRG